MGWQVSRQTERISARKAELREMAERGEFDHVVTSSPEPELHMRTEQRATVTMDLWEIEQIQRALAELEKTEDDFRHHTLERRVIRWRAIAQAKSPTERGRRRR